MSDEPATVLTGLEAAAAAGRPETRAGTEPR
jgi:hypothetical protein